MAVCVDSTHLLSYSKAEEKEAVTEKKEKATKAAAATKAQKDQAAKEKKEKSATPLLFYVSSY